MVMKNFGITVFILIKLLFTYIITLLIILFLMNCFPLLKEHNLIVGTIGGFIIATIFYLWIKPERKIIFKK